MASLSPARPEQRRQATQLFFLGAHLIILAAVVLGFSRSFFLRPLFSATPLPSVLVVHGVVLTGWFILVLTQAILVQTARPRAHRRFGWVVGAYASLVVILGLLADVSLASGIRSAADPENIVAWGNLFTLVLFSIFVAMAIRLRRRPDMHKRLILLASISILGPATARFTNWPLFPGGFEARPAYGIGGLLLLCGALLAYDLHSERRLHPASWMGSAALVLSLAAAVFLGLSGAGFGLLQRL